MRRFLTRLVVSLHGQSSEVQRLLQSLQGQGWQVGSRRSDAPDLQGLQEHRPRQQLPAQTRPLARSRSRSHFGMIH